MTSLATLGADDLREVMGRFRDALRQHQVDINRLNVYPVPDGDTGTNMALTLEAVVTELEGVEKGADLPEVCKAIGHGSLMGARGNSGVILSQLLRGMCERMGAAGPAGVDAAVLADALAHAADLARRAVVRPVEGTILTVASAAAEGATAGAAEDGATLCSTVERAHLVAADALARTPEMLPVLAQAGVVDAGGTGFLLLLDACWAVIDMAHLVPEPSGVPAVDLSRLGANGTFAEGGGEGPHEVGDLRYEVMYLLHAPDDTMGDFKEVWAGIGDSIVVVGGDGLWNCHIHTDDIGAAIEAGVDAGRPQRIRVTDLAEQVEEERWVREAASGPDAGPVAPGGPAPTTSVVAVVTGDGIGRIFRSLGVHHQVVGGQSMNPSTQDLLSAVELVGSAEVVILPNNKNIRPVAEQVDALTDKTVRVVSTGSILEGFAALLAYDPAAGASANALSMGESAARVVPGEITRAVRDTTTDAGEVHEGDWIGVSRDGVISIADSAVMATRLLLSRLLEAQHELVTLIEGEGSKAGDTRRISEWLQEEHPDIALEVHHGGQPLYPYLLGIE
jgi:DAK2 domain fusion protein YloV